MKKTICLLVLSAFFAGENLINSQNIAVKESVDSINSILKANPYFDGFNEIAFYYSINITAEKELVVEMNFDGPFKWIYKAKITDLDISLKKDPCKESPSSLCWTCKIPESGEHVSCVKAEMLMTDGGSQIENSSNICVSFSNRGMICNDLNRRFRQLFSKVIDEIQ